MILADSIMALFTTNRLVCVALAAALPGEIVIVAGLAEQLIAVADAPGIAIDWSLEPAFGGIAWYNDRANSPQRT